ncbi:MAG: hypothetical protein J0L94_09475 [Rhodothermia bacterium]|mgnify:CR=1 FL=1|nr:hypothetical protein [Rhodothermia bacterium]
MTIAIWSEPSGDWLASAYAFLGHSVLRLPAYATHEALMRGKVEAALLPTLTVLREPDLYTISLQVGLVAGAYPFMQFLVRDGLDKIKRVAFDPRYVQEVLMARILLAEHYQTNAKFLPFVDETLTEVIEKSDTVLWPNNGDAPTATFNLDLGQEWMDLTAYPTIWAVMAMRKDTMDDEKSEALAAILDRSMPLVKPQNEAQEDFWQTHFSARIDDFALAGLTATIETFFHHGVLEELPNVPFYQTLQEQTETDTEDEEEE